MITEEEIDRAFQQLGQREIIKEIVSYISASVYQDAKSEPKATVKRKLKDAVEVDLSEL
ncbi:hypothetical protein N9937_02090 [bacterium]|nr:hypothetical protein [bacterium]